MAATKLPANSVGTPQLKANAVTSFKVKNGSLLRIDFKAGQLTGGAPGSAGSKGDKGDTGPSDGFSRAVNAPVTLPANTPTTVATLSLPQGKFVIWAKTYFATSTGGATVGCDLRAGNDADISYAWVNTTVVHETLALNAVHEYSNPGTADLVCTSTAAATANRSRITAIKVATLTVSG